MAARGPGPRAGKEGGAVFRQPGRSRAREPDGVQGRGAWAQGCPGPGCSVQPGQQGLGHGAALKALELHPGQLPMHRGPQGGGKVRGGGTTGHHTPKLSTKNGRFGPRECRSSGGQMGRPAGSPGDGRGPSTVLYELPSSPGQPVCTGSSTTQGARKPLILRRVCMFGRGPDVSAG